MKDCRCIIRRKETRKSLLLSACFLLVEPPKKLTQSLINLTESQRTPLGTDTRILIRDRHQFILAGYVPRLMKHLTLNEGYIRVFDSYTIGMG